MPQLPDDPFADLPSASTATRGDDPFSDLPTRGAHPARKPEATQRKPLIPERMRGDAVAGMDPATQAPGILSGMHHASGAEGIAADAMQMGVDAMRHPLDTGAGLVEGMLSPGWTMGRYAGQQMALDAERHGFKRSPYAGKGPLLEDVSGKDALIAAGQAGVMLATDGIEGAAERQLIERTALNPRLIGALVKGGVGAGAGAAFMPDKPGMGALVGGVLGLAGEHVKPSPSDPAFRVRQRKINDIVLNAHEEGPHGRILLDAAHADAIGRNDMEAAHLLRDATAQYDKMRRAEKRAVARGAAPAPDVAEPDAAPADEPPVASAATTPIATPIAEPVATPIAAPTSEPLVEADDPALEGAPDATVKRAKRGKRAAAPVPELATGPELATNAVEPGAAASSSVSEPPATAPADPVDTHIAAVEAAWNGPGTLAERYAAARSEIAARAPQLDEHITSQLHDALDEELANALHEQPAEQPAQAVAPEPTPVAEPTPEPTQALATPEPEPVAAEPAPVAEHASAPAVDDDALHRALRWVRSEGALPGDTGLTPGLTEAVAPYVERTSEKHNLHGLTDAGHAKLAELDTRAAGGRSALEAERASLADAVEGMDATADRARAGRAGRSGRGTKMEREGLARDAEHRRALMDRIDEIDGMLAHGAPESATAPAPESVAVPPVDVPAAPTSPLDEKIATTQRRLERHRARGTSPSLVEKYAQELAELERQKRAQAGRAAGTPLTLDDLSKPEKAAYERAAWSAVEGRSGVARALEAGSDYSGALDDLTARERALHDQRTQLGMAPAETAGTAMLREHGQPVPWLDGVDAVAEPEPVAASEPAPRKGKGGAARPPLDESKMHPTMRTPSGEKFRPVERVQTVALIEEWAAQQKQIETDLERTPYRWQRDEDMHSTDDGRAVMGADRGANGVTYQSQAKKRVEQALGVQARIEAELQRRGVDLSDMHGVIDQLREDGKIGGETKDADDWFGFGANGDDGLSGVTAFSNPIGPAMRELSRTLHTVWDSNGSRLMRDSFKQVFDPASRSAQAGQAAGVVRARNGQLARSVEQAFHALHAIGKMFEPMPDAERLAFIHRMETGVAQPTPELEAVAREIRHQLDSARDEIIALGTGKLAHFIADYFPHIWDDPANAAKVFSASAGKRPMEGAKAFLKRRTIPTTADGIALGLTPVTTNPIDLTLLKVREMRRYLMAQNVMAELKGKGLVSYVPSGSKAPAGYRQINDRVGTVFGPRHGAVTLPGDAVHAIPGGTLGPAGPRVLPDEVAVHGTRIMGQYWAPEPVATVLNNYLSPGLRGNAMFDLYRGIGNTLNLAQLGLSAFHFGVTSLDAAVSRTALGLEQLSHGKLLTGLGSIASTPFAPVTNAIEGHRLHRAYLNPGSATGDMATIANFVAEAGGRIRQDPFYGSAAKNFRDAWRDQRWAKAGVHALPAILEKTMAPLMEFVVPRQKLGVFADLAREALSQLPPGATDDMSRAVLQKAWDSVDNRMGQMVYDNLFWNKVVKDLSMASVRSVGWNLGTIRELGGGIKDVARMADQGIRGQRPVLTHRAAYLAALPVVVGMAGAVVNFGLTGEPPKELKDYYFPRTGTFDADGNPNRVQLPSYMRDLFSYSGHPWQTVQHKLSPVLSMVGEMLNNEDFYGDQIRNPDDPLVRQLGQEAAFIGKTTIPFAIRNGQEAAKRGDRPVERVLSEFGVTPAPRSTVRTPAQNKLADYTQALLPGGASPEDREARDDRSGVLHALRSHGAEDVKPLLRTAIANKSLDRSQLVRLLSRAKETPMQERFKALPLEQAFRVMELADDRERGLFAPVLTRKIKNALAEGADKDAIVLAVQHLARHSEP